jgi:hypothetical protein
MKIKIETDDELKKIAEELLHILVNLRHSTKLWSEHYGAELSNKKKRWERVADEFLQKLEVERSTDKKEMQIEIEKI